MAVPEATRVAALADWDSGMAIGAVAKKYGISKGVLSLWRKTRAEGSTLNRGGSNLNRGGKRSGGKASKKKIGIAKEAPKPSHARPGVLDLSTAPEMASRLRHGAWGLTNILASVGDAVAARQRAEGERAKLRSAGKTAKEIDELCPLPALPDMRQMDAGSRALRNLLDIAPGLASFDLTTGAAPHSGLTADEREALDAVMLAEAEPAGLTVVPGGRASTGGA